VTRRVWDLFLFSGELDVLEMRLRHLEDAVYRHVLVEADITFSGQPKPFWFAENRDRFGPWLDKIVHVGVDARELPAGIDAPSTSPVPLLGFCANAWAREKTQREQCWRGTYCMEDTDIVLVGDVDELPSLPAMDQLQRQPPVSPVVLGMRDHLFTVNWMHPREERGTFAQTYGRLEGAKLAELRAGRYKFRPLPESGWHFSWLGGPDAIRAKAVTTAHQELAYTVTQNADRIYRTGWCPWDGLQLTATEVDGTYPDYVYKRQCPDSWFRPRPDGSVQQ
jgi:hypothetical protein